jgi:hypothetical protein
MENARTLCNIHRTKLLPVGTGKTVRLVITISRQFHSESNLNKPPHIQRHCVASRALSASNKLSRTNIKTLAPAQTLITVYQMRPTSLAFIYNSRQGTLAGFHANCWVSNLWVCQLITFISNRLPSSAGNLSVRLSSTNSEQRVAKCIRSQGCSENTQV